MNGVIRCPSCGNSMIEEELENHRRGIPPPSITRVMDISYVWWLSEKEANGRFIAIMGVDGTLYRFLPTVSDTRRGHLDDRTVYKLVYC